MYVWYGSYRCTFNILVLVDTIVGIPSARGPELLCVTDSGIAKCVSSCFPSKAPTGLIVRRLSTPMGIQREDSSTKTDLIADNIGRELHRGLLK